MLFGPTAPKAGPAAIVLASAALAGLLLAGAPIPGSFGAPGTAPAAAGTLHASPGTAPSTVTHAPGAPVPASGYVTPPFFNDTTVGLSDPNELACQVYSGSTYRDTYCYNWTINPSLVGLASGHLGIAY